MPKLVLKEINLVNFATFENQTIKFNKNFNAITGETGSGKSLILDGIQLVLGYRADKKLIRKGSDFAVIEAIFDTSCSEIKSFFEKHGYPFQDQITIKRVISNENSARCYINFQSGTLKFLKTFSRRFFDLVGQFENQKLLTSHYQLVLLDSFSKNHLIDEYKTKFDKLNELQKEIQKLEIEAEHKKKHKSFLEYQIDELEDFNPIEGEELNLNKIKSDYRNKEKKVEILQSCNTLLSSFENDCNLESLASILNKTLSSSYEFFNDTLIDKSELLIDTINELSCKISQLLNQQDEEHDLELILDRLDSYQKLKNKHKINADKLPSRLEELKKELLELNTDIDYTSDIKQQVKLLRAEMHDIAAQMTTLRRKAARNLSLKLEKSIQKLNMLGSSIKINITSSKELNACGSDQIEFLVQTNRGEGFHKLKDIASGGELSRILLALRQIVSSQDTISIFLFDEVDTGIGGNTALKIGTCLKDVSKDSQVIAITHLPQIASAADDIIDIGKVYKEDEKRTVSFACIISTEKRLHHLESMSPIVQ